MPNYRSLLAQKAALDRKIEQARKREVGAVVKQVNALIAEYGLKADELTFPAANGKKAAVAAPARRARAARAAAPASEPKYRDPETGKTWTGRGRAPRWLVGDKEQYLIR